MRPLFTFKLSANQINGFSAGRYFLKTRINEKEINMMLAAGDCAVAPLCVVKGTDRRRNERDGFFMKCETPLKDALPNLNADQRKAAINEMFFVMRKLHEKGIVHWDMRPDNLVICSDGRLRLIDFGNSQYATSAVYDPEGEGPTLRYRSPKRVQMGLKYPPRKEDDYYAAGLSAYEIATDKVPFAELEDDYDEIHQAIKRGQAPDLNKILDIGLKTQVEGWLRLGNQW